MLLSVLTALHPATPTRFLRDCFTSLCLVQEALPPGIQWLIQCDGPHPEAEELVRSLRRGNSWIEISSSHTCTGAAIARNEALAASNGKYVTPLDGDDVLDALELARLVAELEDRPQIRWALGRTFSFGDGPPNQTGELEVSFGELRSGDVNRVWERSGRQPFLGGPIVAEAALVRSVGGWPRVSHYEDMGLVLACGGQARGRASRRKYYGYRRWTRGEFFQSRQTDFGGKAKSMSQLVGPEPDRTVVFSPAEVASAPRSR